MATMWRAGLACVVTLWLLPSSQGLNLFVAGRQKHNLLVPSPQARRQAMLRSSQLASSSNEDLSVQQDFLDQTIPSISSRREVKRLEKFARLPVWPVWNGVFLFFVSKIFGEEIGAKLEDAIGGRVCPNFWDPNQTSPFIMLVHHRHSFAPWDPLRFIQRTFFPEGFPAHPHRGFVTVTYILKGGFLHRDSMGVKQIYGAEPRHNGKHTQWLYTGAGILHEEMFDIAPDKTGGLEFLQPSSQELYQLWLNVPAIKKLDYPFTKLLGGQEETPTVVTKAADGSVKTETIVLAGHHGAKESASPTMSDVGIFHVKMNPNAVWTHESPSSHTTGIIYMRTGSAIVGGKTRIPPHYTGYLSSIGSLEVTSMEEGADFLL